MTLPTAIPYVSAMSRKHRILLVHAALAACPGYGSRKPEATKPSVTSACHPRLDNIQGPHGHFPDTPCVDY